MAWVVLGRQPTLAGMDNQPADRSSVAILADDLMWSTRLADLVTAAGWRPVVVRSLPDLATTLATVGPVIVDLTARAYDGIAAVEVAAHSDHRVLCVGQHDDLDLRKRALEAGAERVYAYRLLSERGAVLHGWLNQAAESAGAAESSTPAAMTDATPSSEPDGADET